MVKNRFSGQWVVVFFFNIIFYNLNILKKYKNNVALEFGNGKVRMIFQITFPLENDARWTFFLLLFWRILISNVKNSGIPLEINFLWLKTVFLVLAVYQ